jgi:membrane-associated phospholipid phosphatase
MTEFGPTVTRFDDWADQQLERLRGNPAADFLFTNASHLGDFSVIWHIVGLARGLTSDRRADEAIALSIALGAESLLVNQGIKRLFRRTRPTETGDARFTVRKPSTSSFPSGHASSAFFAATLLTGWSAKRSAPMWFGLAAVVGVSRAYVRIHHMTDVVGGAVLGLALGRVARRVLRAAPSSRRRGLA